MKTFKLPDITPPDSVHTLAEARDALDRANRQLCNTAVCMAALEQASADLAKDLGRLPAVAEAGRLESIQACATAIRKRYSLDLPRTH